jgi:uncharacterized protein
VKLQTDRILGQTITGHGAGWIALDGEKFHQSLLIAWTGWRFVGAVSLTDLPSSTQITALLKVEPEILIIGCGAKKIAIPNQHLATLMSQKIGIETMDTAAACRTYNILAGENRKVAAILLI